MDEYDDVRLEISGPDVAIGALIALTTSRYAPFDLREFLPIPEKVQLTRDEKAWCCAVWGTPCNVDCDGKSKQWERRPGFAAICFTGHWGHPQYALLALSRQFPMLRFLVETRNLELDSDLYVIEDGEIPEVGRVQGRSVSVDPKIYMAWLAANHFVIRPECGPECGVVYHDPEFWFKGTGSSSPQIAAVEARVAAVRELALSFEADNPTTKRHSYQMPRGA